MNSDFVRWPRDIDAIPRGRQDLHLAWERPWPAWAWALILHRRRFVRDLELQRPRGQSRRPRHPRRLRGFLIVMLALVLGERADVGIARAGTVEEDWVIIAFADRIVDDHRRRTAYPLTMRVMKRGPHQSRSATQEAARQPRRAGVLTRTVTRAQVVSAGLPLRRVRISKAVQHQRQRSALTTAPLARFCRGAEREKRPVLDPDLGLADRRRTNIDARFGASPARAAARPSAASCCSATAAAIRRSRRWSSVVCRLTRSRSSSCRSARKP